MGFTSCSGAQDVKPRVLFYSPRRTMRSRLLAVSPWPRADMSAPSSLANVYFSMFFFAVLSPLLPGLKHQLALSTAQAGLLVAMYAIGATILMVRMRANFIHRKFSESGTRTATESAFRSNSKNRNGCCCTRAWKRCKARSTRISSLIR